MVFYRFISDQLVNSAVIERELSAKKYMTKKMKPLPFEIVTGER
jgi:hypothetical protein